LKFDAEIADTLTLELDPTLGVLSPGLAHAPTARATVAAAVVQASFLVTRSKVTTRFVPRSDVAAPCYLVAREQIVPYGSFQSISSAPWLTR